MICVANIVFKVVTKISGSAIKAPSRLWAKFKGILVNSR